MKIIFKNQKFQIKLEIAFIILNVNYPPSRQESSLTLNAMIENGINIKLTQLISQQQTLYRQFKTYRQKVFRKKAKSACFSLKINIEYITVVFQRAENTTLNNTISYGFCFPVLPPVPQF